MFNLGLCHIRFALFCLAARWLASPNYFNNNNNNANGRNVNTNGSWNNNNVNNTNGVRPAISLAPGTSFTTGDGLADTPYKVD